MAAASGPDSELGTAITALMATVAMPAADIATLIANALVTTYRRAVTDDPSVRARVDLDNGIWLLSRTDAAGDEVEVPLVGDLARQSANAVRNAVAGRLREVAKDDVIREAETYRGQLLDGIVERNRGAVWTLRIGQHFALLPPEEQMAGETLELHQHVKVVVVDARRRAQDAVLVVSRSHPLLLHLLLEQEVPEVLSGQVIVKGIVREPGRRAKVAVAAASPGIDPRGACIGPRGVRHRAVTGELGEEQVQIVNWSDDPATYIAEALAPAKARSVELDAESHTARVLVDSDQLSLAIGRGGENARLVARLTGWRIDIHPAEAR